MEQDQRLPRPGADTQPDGLANAHELPTRERRTNSGERRPSATSRLCGKCGGPLTGQFVRALESTFHLECFTCHDCGKVVASKFFPEPEQPPHQYPLCETDYFRRLDLLCHTCGGALRGSYITALDRKYHIEHFTCSACSTVFGAADSYYEHDGNVFCHYHYSTRFAQKCNGCQTAILKQFVEIFRNGQNQHWHPECYMIHKYWNVRLHVAGQPILAERKSIGGDAKESDRLKVKHDEEKIEEKVLWIWRTLSQYEEKSATCISDMLLHVSNGAYVDGVMSAKRFILHVDLLFAAADRLDQLMVARTTKGLSYSREAKLLCKKVVAFFQLLAESQDTGVRRLGVTQELLALVTGLAHYLKLLIRICLQGALKLERDANTDNGLQQFLGHINTLDSTLEAEGGFDESRTVIDYVNISADTCPVCTKPVEDRCFRHKGKVFHYMCMKCESCQRDLFQISGDARWDESDERLLCRQCLQEPREDSGGFKPISRLQQYVHLLRVAHARLLATLRTSGALPHTSDDPNLDKYDSRSGRRMAGGIERPEPTALQRSNTTRSNSYSGKASAEENVTSSYEQTLGDIRRLRSTRMEKQLSSTTKRARTSQIIGGPQGSSARPGSAGRESPTGPKPGFHIVRDRDASGEQIPHLAFGNADSIGLDDIPRLVAAEQAKEQRPNANKYARGGLLQSEPKPKLLSSHRREMSGGQELEKLGPEGHRPKRYFSELTPLDYFVVRHVAVLSMEPLLEGLFNQEELLELIEMRKQTFWGKFGKAFNKDKNKTSRKKGVFGVALDVLIEKDGAESTDGIGPGVLRVPALVQDALTAMRSMDMTIEGVFRKNGNIRRLREMAETIDTKGGDAVNLEVESPVQVAALLKKFLRELPDPVMTYKLHRLFITAQKIEDYDRRRRVMHLTCCLLPKAHRDTMEVLFCFLNWAASFSAVDEESGSKMDVHNLATVVAPNILFSNNKSDTMEESFLAIESISFLIEYNQIMSEVPEDLQQVLNDSSLFSGSADLTTKEILKRYGDIAKPVQTTHQQNDSSSHSREARGTAPVVTHVDSLNPPSASARQAEKTSVRPVPPGGSHGPSPNPGAHFMPQNTPPPPPYANGGFYANPMSGSRDSFGANGSPSRYGGRHYRNEPPNGHQDGIT
ncbi:MAG: hypothetical protein M1828_005578 [Chrysothrix sp. TS-e1954]|nr:MAG: hypothetical protein M1828_005578 [Chrysothrix sp. TS-e1954]